MTDDTAAVAAEDTTNAAAPDGAQAAGAADPGPGSDVPAADQPQDDVGQRPSWCPEKFWDAAKGAMKTEAMARSYGELEKRARDFTVPREYKLNLPDGAEDLGIFVDADCPLATTVLDAAKEAKMPQKHVDAMVGAWAKSFERAREHEMSRLLKEQGGDQTALSTRLSELRGRGEAMFGPGSAFAAKNGLSDAQAREAVQVFRQMASAATSVKMLEYILSGDGAQAIGSLSGMPSAPPATDVPSMDEVRRWQASGEYQRGDKAMVDKVNDAYKRMSRAGKL